MTNLSRSGRARIRLPHAAYSMPGSAWLVTIGTAGRASVFANEDIARAMAALMEERCVLGGVALDAYCLMPDHGHLLIQVTTGNLVDVIRDIKSRSTRLWWRHGGRGALWQRSFHDRGLRTPHDYDLAFTYVLENPVRAGLVADWSEYPHLGGTYVRPSLSRSISQS